MAGRAWLGPWTSDGRYSAGGHAFPAPDDACLGWSGGQDPDEGAEVVQEEEGHDCSVGRARTILDGGERLIIARGGGNEKTARRSVPGSTSLGRPKRSTSIDRATAKSG